VTPGGTQHVLYENEKSGEFDALITRLKQENKWVKINQVGVAFSPHSQYSLCLVQYPASMVAPLREAVANCELGALDRIQLLLDMKRLCNAQRVTPAALLQFLDAYKDEKDWSVLEFVASMVMSLYEYVDEKDAELKQKYQAFANRMYVMRIVVTA
jgi:singapore isolate B (sub-type 7) whole genome shotgun sequence assembly, scaffold_18